MGSPTVIQKDISSTPLESTDKKPLIENDAEQIKEVSFQNSEPRTINEQPLLKERESSIREILEKYDNEQANNE